MAAEDTVINQDFYAPWPLFGKKLSQQWGESRTNFSRLAPLVRGIGLDASGDFSTLSGAEKAAIQAYEVGEQDFHNKFRTHYDKTDVLYEIEFNSGTQAVPDWTTLWSLDSSGNVTGQSGEANTASNLGTTTFGLFAQKNIIDLEFKSLVAGSGVDLSASSTEVTVAATGNFSGIVRAEAFYLGFHNSGLSTDSSGNLLIDSGDNNVQINPNAELEVVGDIVSKGTRWTSRTSAADNDWRVLAYGNGLFVAVGQTGTGDRVMTSPDGVNWTTRISAADNTWRGILSGHCFSCYTFLYGDT